MRRFRRFEPLGLVIAAALAACGGSSASPHVATSTRLVAPEGLAARIDVHRPSGRPVVALVAREGDPSLGLAAVLTLDETSMGAAPWLAAVLEARLERAGRPADARIVQGAILLAWSSAEGRGAWADERALLLAPVKSEELGPIARRAGALSAAPATPGLEAATACTGAPSGTSEAWDPASPRTVAVVERLRAESLTVQRASLAIVGSPAKVEEALKKLEEGDSWPEGAPVTRPPLPAGATLFPAGETRGAGARRSEPDVVVAVPLAPASRGAAIARSLEVAGSPLASQLRLLAPGFEIASATGVARSGRGGSCLRLELAAANPEALDASAAALAADTARRWAVGTSPEGEVELAARAILEADDPREAAMRAAWWTTTGDLEGSPSRVAVAMAAKTTPNEKARVDLERELDRIARLPARPRNLEVRTRVESGQGAFRVLVGSPCAPGLGSPVSAAETAIGLVAAARVPTDEVELTPFVEEASAGLFARALPRRGETPTELAARVGDAIARALAGPAPPASLLADARGGLVERASRGWGHPEGAEAFARALSPDRPARVAPLGLEIPLLRADASAASARTAALLRAPLRVAILANADASQAEAAVDAIRRHLPPSETTTCPAPATLARPVLGRTDVRVAGDEPFAQITMGLAIRADLADAAAALLEDESGPLAGAAAKVGASVRVSVSADAMISIDVRCAPERAEEALLAAQGALASLARGEIGATTLTRSRDLVAERLRARAADPGERLRALWRDRAAATSSDPKAAAVELAPERWVVVVARPG